MAKNPFTGKYVVISGEGISLSTKQEVDRLDPHLHQVFYIGEEGIRKTQYNKGFIPAEVLELSHPVIRKIKTSLRC
jgi:hypothetical protein